MTIEVHTRIRDWRSRAACMTIAEPQRVFFPIGEEPSPEDVLEAKAICGRCPVTAQCLDYAVDTHQGHGIWGGLTPPERDEVVRSAMRTRRR